MGRPGKNAPYEYRCAGYTATASIRKGVYETGSIITCAGIIMILAFGGLLGSTVNMINQDGFLLVCSVFFDTFVVRTIMIPAIMSLVDSWETDNLAPVSRSVADSIK